VPIRDSIISLLTQMTAENLETLKGKDKLRAEIRSVINAALRKEEVKRVYFTQFVIQ
jgi:flagellar FliL protein